MESSHATKPSPINILIIEDDPSTVSLISKVLSQDSYMMFRIIQVPRLSEALKRLSQEKIDIILLDLSLADSAGLETFETMHKHHPEIPIIILSSCSDDQLALDAVRAGAQDYLTKDKIGPDFLTQSVQHAIERNRLIRRLETVTQELRVSNDRLKSLSLLDSLTGLLNRRGVQGALSREIQWALRNNNQLYAMLINVDDFKKINHAIGHASGDVVLREIGIKLKTALRTTDYIARIGGDEYFILLPNSNEKDALQIAERLQSVIFKTPVELSSGTHLKMTASIAILLTNQETPSIDELLSKMRPKLVQGRKKGKNQITLDHSGEPQSECDLTKTAEPQDVDIYQVLQNGTHIHAVKQPIFNLIQNEILGYEFLSRTNVRGFENPEMFFRACIEANILTFVDHKCLKTCITASKDLPPESQRHLNLFPSTIIDIPVEHLLEVFPENRLKNSYCIELSEQQIIGNPYYLSKPIEQLKTSGILIAIDDVGFGRTCLESLIILEPNIIKIDKKCINGLADDIIRVKHLTRILKLSEALGADVIAEGIERQEDLVVLKRMGVKYGQGFLLGRPE